MKVIMIMKSNVDLDVIGTVFIFFFFIKDILSI